MGEHAARPILFSGAMVRALLDGSKTQTRRLVKGEGPGQALGWLSAGFDPAFVASTDNGLCPYGVPGDLLWVRETVRAEELSRPPKERAATRRERAAMRRTTVIELDDLDGFDGVRYVANDEWRKIANTAAAGDAWSVLFHYRGRGKGLIGNPVPSIHMPRWASRLTLEITEARIERLQDISEADARAEGAPQLWTDGEGAFFEGERGNFLTGFAGVWSHINGVESWDADPWVWAVSFKVHQQNVDQFLAREGKQSASEPPQNNSTPET